MAIINQVLFRDDIGDKGEQPSHGSYCGSPDIIVHKDVSDPDTYFKNNYNEYVTEAVDRKSRINYIYTRVKNLTSSEVKGRIQVYASRASLFMTPSIWLDNILYTPEDPSGNKNNYVNFDAQKESIAVGSSPLILSGVDNNNFCLVGIACDEKGPEIQGDFKSYSDFVCWVRDNKGVCVRNMSAQNISTLKDYEGSYSLENPYSTEPPAAMLNIIASDVLVGTVYGVECQALGICQEWTARSTNARNGIVINLPAGFNGVVKVYAKLPSGQSVWPVKARVRMESWIGMTAAEKAFCYGRGIHEFLHNCDDLRFMDFANGGGKLVKIGECGMVTVDG